MNLTDETLGRLATKIADLVEERLDQSQPELISTKEAATMMQRSPRTLEFWRSEDTPIRKEGPGKHWGGGEVGPYYRKPANGRVEYYRPAVRAWARGARMPAPWEEG